MKRGPTISWHLFIHIIYATAFGQTGSHSYSVTKCRCMLLCTANHSHFFFVQLFEERPIWSRLALDTKVKLPQSLLRR